MDQVKLEEEEVEGGLCRQIESRNVGVDEALRQQGERVSADRATRCCTAKMLPSHGERGDGRLASSASRVWPSCGIFASGGSRILSKGIPHKNIHTQFDKLIYQFGKRSQNLQHNSMYMH